MATTVFRAVPERKRTRGNRTPGASVVLPSPPLEIAVLLLPLLVAAQLQGVPGYRYTFRMTPDHGGRIAGTVREDGRNARIDFDAGRQGDDEYLLVRPGQLLVVHPDEREYSVVDDSTFERIAGVGLQAASDVGVVRFRVRDAQITPERLGPGDSIAGFATQRVRLTEEFTVEVSAFGMRGDAVHMRVITDYWLSARPLLMHNPLIEMLSRLGTVLGQSDPVFVRRQAAARQGLIAGTPLKVVVTAWSRDRDEHDDRPSVTTIEIGDLTRTTVDPEIFRIPPGLRRRDGEFSWRF
jgi:hypothetical protein